MEGRSKILGWVVAGLVIGLALLTVIIVRSSAQPEPPDLTPVEVTPETSAPSSADGSQGTGDSAGRPSRASDPSETSDPSHPSESSDPSSDESSVPDELEHSYEPVPNPPREVPDDSDDGDDDDGDDGDDDD